MPQYTLGGMALPNSAYKKVAASATTAQVSTPDDLVPGRDYIERIIITCASTAAPGNVTLFDGTTSILVHSVASGQVDTIFNYELNITASSTKGFNITTGTSVSVVAIGRF